MSNLTNLMNGGEIAVAEATEFESITEAQMVQLIEMAIQDIAVEEMMESLSADDALLMEGVLPEDAVVMEKTIVRMDKAAKKQKAYKLAILQCAKDDDNKDYKKLETLWKMQKYLMRRLEKRYATKAKSRMHQASKKTGNNKLGAKLKVHLGINSSKPKLTRSQRETQKALAGDTKIPSQIKSQFKNINTSLNSKIK